MLLYDHPLSSYCQKVKIALREKGVAFDAVLPPDLGTGQRDTPFAAANPRVEVPALSVDGSTIFDSTIIMEFVEERWPTPALLPADPLARAYARETEEMCDTHYEAVNWGFAEILWYNRAEGALAQQLKEAAARDTAVLQSWLTHRLGGADWFGGAEFGWADAAAAPMVNRSVYYGFGPTHGSPLFRWLQRLCARPAVATTFSEFDVAAERMASLSDLYTTGGRRREYRDHRLEWMVRSGGISVVAAGLAAGNIRFSWPSDQQPGERGAQCPRLIQYRDSSTISFV